MIIKGRYLFVLSILFILTIFYLPINYLINFTVDDSYFYLKTAINFAKEGKSTFDGINLTNGYHPFWFLICSFVYSLISIFKLNSVDLYLKSIFISTALIDILILYFVNKVLGEFDLLKNRLTFGLSTLLLIPLVLFYIVGMEIQIFLLFFIISIYLLSRFFKNPENKFLKVKLAISFSILFLCRVDLFWYFLMLVFVYSYLRKRDLLIELVKISILLVVVFLIYVIINKSIFGVFYPIMTYYKLSFDINENLKLFPTPLKNPIDFLVLVLISGLTIFTLVYKNRLPDQIKSSYSFELIFWSNILFIFFLIVNFLINSNGVREWYYVFPMFTSIFIFSISISEREYSRLILMLLVILNVFYFFLFRNNYYNHKSAYEYALKLKKVLPENVKIFQIDYSGLISFFSERKIINGDGLINSFEYWLFVRSGKLPEYLRRINPDYFSFFAFSNSVDNDRVKYKFQVMKKYEIQFPLSNLILREPLIYGGIFRRKLGNFYLLKFNEYQIISK